MRKSKLVVDPLFDFDLVGLISHAKGYRIAWELNRTLEVQLIKAKDQIIRFNDGNAITVVNYYYKTENAGLFLLRNRSIETKESGQMLLIPELQEFDFFLKIKGADSFDAEEIAKIVRNIKIIQYSSLIDPINLKSKENLVFDYE
ncbi:MAG TPA: IPExxxVDY family protein [Cyclobacteriaceae bacterium]|jgi:hypothetical protein